MLHYAFFLGVFHDGSDDEIVGDGTDDGHRDVGYGVAQAKQLNKEQHESHAHDKKVEHVRSDDAYEVESGGLRLESPIDGEEIIDAEGDEIAGDERDLIGGEEAHDVEYGCVYHRACPADDAETDELLRLLLAQEFLYLIDHCVVL